jgi:phenylacetate-coenzyme A ligase PaaK-like adenylate-forming protein
MRMNTRAEPNERKLAKFRALVRHANACAPYYAKIIRERAINPDTCVPMDFPVLTKSALMANFDENPSQDRCRLSDPIIRPERPAVQ